MAGGAGARRGPQGQPVPQHNQGGNYNGPPPGYNNNGGGNFNGNLNGPPPGNYNNGSNFNGGNFNGPQPGNYNNVGNFNGPPPGNYNGPQPSKPRSGGFDGPGEPQRDPNPYGPGLGYDPAKPANKLAEKKVITNSRVELPASAYKLEGGNYDFPSDLPLRPGVNTTGKGITIRVNQFKVSQWPQRDVYQYDINIGNGAEKKGKIMAVWMSRAVQERLKQISPGPSLLWDGNKLLWYVLMIWLVTSLTDLRSSTKFQEQRIMVDFDKEKGRQPHPTKGSDTCYCIIRPAKEVRMAVIKGYLEKKMPFDNSILEAISFLDHLMRQWPSQSYTLIKRSFFTKGNVATPLDNVVVAMKGVYASIRLCSPVSSVGQPSTGLAINVDVANGTFWAPQDVHQAARNYCRDRNRQLSYTIFRDLLKPVKTPKGVVTQSEDFKNLRKMAKLKFRVKHRGKADDNKIYTIKSFHWSGATEDGAHAKNTVFKWKNRQTNSEEEITVYNYFKRIYNIDLQYWYLPLIVTDRAGMFPMELCHLIPNQRYNFKMSPEQTASMIKFAVTRPKQRIESINHGVGMLKWTEDPYMKHFGLTVDPQMTVTAARLLPNPEVQFAGKKLNPGTQGRWDLRGQKFLLPNTEPLKSWGFVILDGCTNEQVLRNFINVFIQTYTGHGGRIENRNPVIYNQGRGEEIPGCVVNARNAIGNQASLLPQIIFYVMGSRDSFKYERLKRNTECRFAMVSQCVNVAHVVKAQPQYCSNVAMKVNAKLGGTTCKVVNAKNWFTAPTMILGADVSHPSPGSPQASMAALTMSFDQNACRYAAAVQTNGHRVEMITPGNIRSMMIPLFEQWVAKVGGGRGPQHIYYFRDGVSEGQYSHVLNNELSQMKEALVEKYGAQIKWTVVVCTKRHHIRFFPKDGDNQAGDRNSNPLPGTLVERDVTHPFEYDFYLNSHSAIQGTARPVHYHVLQDDAKVPVAELQKMIYQFSYQYMRSTTPVSLFPAVYYAHLASNRARAHDSAPASEGPRGGQKFEEARQDAAVRAAVRGTQPGSSQTGSSLPTEVAPLVPLGNPDQGNDMVVKIRNGMWYI
ncbi:Piwi-domain-containing protein [Stipitochalara longipes BDJ]|nr:Piwi-domain-containing protein [Stipitochalara longipes BDJ]